MHALFCGSIYGYLCKFDATYLITFTEFIVGNLLLLSKLQGKY
jgi:hypothetical protein